MGQIISLNPSDAILREFDKKLLSNTKGGKTIDENQINENLYSIVLMLKGNFPDVLIGGDLQVNFSRKSHDDISCPECREVMENGLCDITVSSAYNNNMKFGYIKIPHHSSNTGYCPKIWGIFKNKNVIASSTMFLNNSGVLLPRKAMLQTYLNKSSEYYLTSSYPINSKDKNGRSEIDEKNYLFDKIKVIPDSIGVVSTKWNNKTSQWETQIFGDAIRVTQDYVDKYVDKVI